LGRKSLSASPRGNRDPACADGGGEGPAPLAEPLQRTSGGTAPFRTHVREVVAAVTVET
jgi:hypothetical protein